MSRNNKQCIYCCRITELTKDHVPPKNIFKGNMNNIGNKNLITVPSCKKCNREYGQDLDENFKIYLGYQCVGKLNTGNKELDCFIASVKKSLNKNKRMHAQVENVLRISRLEKK